MKKSKILFTLVTCLIISPLSAQIWVLGGKKIYGNGNEIIKTQSIKDFNGISVIGNLEVVFDTSLTNEIKIESEENLIPYIKIKASNKRKLTIKNPVKHQLITTGKKRIKISIPYKKLDFISLSGSGLISLNKRINTKNLISYVRGSGKIVLNVDTSILEAKISGSGTIRIQGKSTESNFKIRGTGQINAEDLNTDSGNIHLSGNAYVKVNEQSSYKITKRGSSKVKTVEGKLGQLDYDTNATRNASLSQHSTNYTETIKNWKSVNDVHHWIKNNFQYDFDRAVLLSNNSQAKSKTAIYEPQELWTKKTGMCVDLSRFAFETIKSINPTQKAKYLRIKFEPVEINGNKFVNHWLVSYKDNDGYYFFADTKRPDVMDGPYQTVDDFIYKYENFRNRKINSFKQLDSYKKKKKTKSYKHQKLN